MLKNNLLLPKHLAIIPDGNRRWAKKRNLLIWQGHEAGAKNTENLVRQALDLGIQYFSIWGSSLSNLQKRSILEKKALLKIYEKYFTKLINSVDVHQNQVKISIIGRWQEYFPSSLKNVLENCLQKTKQYSRYFLNFFLAYSGDDEMLEAIRKIIQQKKKSYQISAQVLKENLWTKNLPPVDFLIRTGGEPHLSAGFLMWDLANTQFFFSQKYYPDFSKEDLKMAILDYQKRQRRLGK